ncbi:MAG: hypothetical protein ABW185_10510, partial [Sedimenticola sp.]
MAALTLFYIMSDDSLVASDPFALGGGLSCLYMPTCGLYSFPTFVVDTNMLVRLYGSCLNDFSHFI